MKLTSILQKLLMMPLLLVLAVGLFTACADDDNELQLGGRKGYVQFRLLKETSYELRTVASELNYLNDAKKIKVVLTSNGITASYTLSLNAYNAEKMQNTVCVQINFS